MSDTDATLISRREIHRGKVVDLDVDRVRLANGRAVDLEVIRHRGAAAIVPVTDDGDVLLVRQYRWATGGWLLEVPAGKLDRGEGPEACAERETEEETGFAVGRLEPLGWIWTTPGFTDERIWLFLARDLRPGRQSLEADELLTVERMPLAEAVRATHDGAIADGKSICAILRAAERLSLD